MSEKSRIEKVMLHEDMSSSQFATEIGVQNSTLSHILNNRNNPSLDVLKKILSRFPEISTDWLILGQGSMIRQEKQSKEPTLFDSIDENSSASISSTKKEYSETASSIPSSRNELLNDDTDARQAHRPAAVSYSQPVQQASTPVENKEKHIYSSISDTGSGTGSVSVDNENGQSTIVNKIHTSFPERKVSKVIVYFTDNTFQEFESK